MKIFKCFPIILSLVFIIGCNNSPAPKSEEVTSSMETTSNPNIQDTISKTTFDQWTQLWDSLGSSYSDTSLVKFYSFPIIDMQEFLGTNATNAFFYQGLEPLGAGKYQAHIILTGSDKKGVSINKYYDVSQPCPPACGPFH